MPLYLFYTMVQKSQKWPKTQIKGGGPALKKKLWDRKRRQNQEMCEKQDPSGNSWVLVLCSVARRLIVRWILAWR